MNITFERAAREIKAGQTVLCDDHPSLVWHAFQDTGTAKVFLTFSTPNAGNIIQMVCEPYDTVTVAPLVRINHD